MCCVVVYSECIYNVTVLLVYSQCVPPPPVSQEVMVNVGDVGKDYEHGVQLLKKLSEFRGTGERVNSFIHPTFIKRYIVLFQCILYLSRAFIL